LVLFLDNGEKMRRLNVILLALTLLISQVVFANEAETQETSPVQAIQTTIVKLNQLTAAATYSPQMMGFLIDQEVAPLFDFDYIADEVLLVVNANLSESEVKFFSNKLKKNIISTLLARLSQANTTSFRFISARPLINGAIAVQLKVIGYSSYGIYIDLMFHQQNNGQWKIYDIVLNRDSLVKYYQKMVLTKVRRYGVYGMLGRI
jgi:ABC-type transport system involved in resistance to organic solvents, auxiliary component